MNKAVIGLIGLGTMGANLARNIASRDIKVAVFNRTAEKTDVFIREFGTENLAGHHSLKNFIDSLEKPRKIILMVSAGQAVDAVIAELKALLETDDIIIDGGNSHYKDTERRQNELAGSKIHLIGMGISGGEHGALHGPSMMPGGSEKAYRQIEPLLMLAAANAAEGGKCIAYIGPAGSGHFVKMVHNGIEYAIMQAIAEAYDILRKLGQLSNTEMAKIFDKWNKTEYLNSFLIEITTKILSKKEEGKDLIDLIKDKGQQKGTGKWTSEASFDYGISAPSITAAVDARMMSGHPTRGEIELPEALNNIPIPDKDNLIKLTHDALTLTTILSYFQGFNLMATASKELNYKIKLPEIARIWSNGCIIRSSLLPHFQQLYAGKETEMLKQFEGENQLNWRKFITLGINRGIPLPTTQSALFYYDSLRASKLPQNLIQAQRDFFGAHDYERTDKHGTFHTNWQ